MAQPDDSLQRLAVQQLVAEPNAGARPAKNRTGSTTAAAAAQFTAELGCRCGFAGRGSGRCLGCPASVQLNSPVAQPGLAGAGPLEILVPSSARESIQAGATGDELGLSPNGRLKLGLRAERLSDQEWDACFGPLWHQPGVRQLVLGVHGESGPLCWLRGQGHLLQLIAAQLRPAVPCGAILVGENFLEIEQKAVAEMKPEQLELIAMLRSVNLIADGLAALLEGPVLGLPVSRVRFRLLGLRLKPGRGGVGIGQIFPTLSRCMRNCLAGRSTIELDGRIRLVGSSRADEVDSSLPDARTGVT